jgi:hypothetical protein
MHFNAPQTSFSSSLHPKPLRTKVRFSGALLEKQKALQETIQLEMEQTKAEARKALISSTDTIFTINGEPLTPMGLLRLIEEVHQMEREKLKPKKRLWNGLATTSGVSGALIGLGLTPLHPGLLILCGAGLFFGLCNSWETKGKARTLFLFKVAELSGNAKNCRNELETVAYKMKKALWPLVSAGFLEVEKRSYKLTRLGHQALQDAQALDQKEHTLDHPRSAIELKAEALLAQVASQQEPFRLETTLQQKTQDSRN